jgi:photosystem II stability/assembly factor-like uncharacterized protein
MLTTGMAGARVVVAGERGIILYSDDAGKSWSQSEVPVSVTLTALHFANDRIGWAVGHDGVVLRTNNAGKNWVKQLDGDRVNAMAHADAESRLKEARAALDSGNGDKTAARQAVERAQFALDDVMAGEKFGPSRPFLGTWFDNETNGYVVGANGQILITKDGGQTWASLTRKLNNPDALHYNAITAGIAGEKFIAGEAGKVYRGGDGGGWQTLDTGYNGALYGVVQLMQSDGREVLLAYGFGGRIFRSTNGGKAWSQTGTGVTAATLVAGVQLKTGGVILLAHDGTVLRSDDGGKTFVADGTGVGLRVAAMAKLPDERALVAAGIGGARLIVLRVRK